MFLVERDKWLLVIKFILHRLSYRENGKRIFGRSGLHYQKAFRNY